jgi:hypothetical protein
MLSRYPACMQATHLTNLHTAKSNNLGASDILRPLECTFARRQHARGTQTRAGLLRALPPLPAPPACTKNVAMTGQLCGMMWLPVNSQPRDRYCVYHHCAGVFAPSMRRPQSPPEDHPESSSSLRSRPRPTMILDLRGNLGGQPSSSGRPAERAWPALPEGLASPRQGLSQNNTSCMLNTVAYLHPCSMEACTRAIVPSQGDCWAMPHCTGKICTLHCTASQTRWKLMLTR